MQMSANFLPAEIMGFVILAIWAVTLLIHICFAVAVYHDAEHLPNGRHPVLVTSQIWFVATLVGGVFVAVAYWVMHHSRLNAAVPVNPPSP